MQQILTSSLYNTNQLEDRFSLLTDYSEIIGSVVPCLGVGGAKKNTNNAVQVNNLSHQQRRRTGRERDPCRGMMGRCCMYYTGVVVCRFARMHAWPACAYRIYRHLSYTLLCRTIADNRGSLRGMYARSFGWP